MSKPKVLYIAAHSRSGSTILDRVLSQVEGAFTVGELRHVWQRSIIENQLCGCNKEFLNCPIWKEIINSASIDSEYAKNMQSLSRNVDRYKKIPQILYPSIRSSVFKKNMKEYLKGLRRIYESIQTVVAPEFVIDSSKSSSYAMLLSNIDNVDLHVVHLVRDSRAVAHSRLRKKRRPEIHWKKEFMAVTPSYKTAFQWNMMNMSMDALKGRTNYSLVKYEDFMANPRFIVQKILEDMGVFDKDLSFINGNTIALDVDHTVSGNPMRFKVGEIELISDVQWNSHLSSLNKSIVKTLTYPWLKKYDYI